MMETSPQAPLPARHDFAFSDRDFRMISDLANGRYGLFLQPSKKALVHSRLAKRLRALNLGSFQEYCDLLDRPEGNDEQAHLLSALTTNVTHFFREAHHFEYLRETIAPKLVVKAKSGQAVRLWSSACSTGQEAYSMAAALVCADPTVHQHDIKILATDIDPKVVQVAREGLYPSEQIAAVPEEWRNLLSASRPTGHGNIAVDDRLKSLISFGELNLVNDWPMQRKLDVIFCRNAAIYFDKATQERLWQRFATALSDDGYLMIGHSERLSGPSQGAFKSVGITSYQIQRDRGERR